MMIHSVESTFPEALTMFQQLSFSIGVWIIVYVGL